MKARTPHTAMVICQGLCGSGSGWRELAAGQDGTGGWLLLQAPAAQQR